MENENIDKNIGLIQKGKNVPNSDNIFKPNYEHQNLSNNPDFHNWKSLMVNKYGDKGKFYECLHDKIFFYSSNEENGHENEIFCPLCKNSACFFCSKVIYCIIDNCCMRSKLRKMFTSGKEGLKAKMEDLDDYGRAAIFYYLFPGMNIIFFIGMIFNFSYYKCVRSNGQAYEDFLHENYIIFGIILAINGVTSIFLSFAFFLYGIYISILLLISLLIKKKILFFVMGFFYEDWRFVYHNYKKVFHING